MTRPLTALALILGLAACDKVQAPKLPVAAGGKAAFDKAKLDAAVDHRFGGVGTCVVIDDTGSGREVYRYGDHATCAYRLPPCSTFKIANSLIGLDAGAVTPSTVFKWDHTPQDVSTWEQDADMKTAFKESIVWWYQRVATVVGKPAYEERLKAFHYGNEKPDGPLTKFWLGPSTGGALAISGFEQAEFLRRLYRDQLPVKPESAAFVKSIMVDETRGQSTMSGKTGTCPSSADRTRQVGWWVGRLQGPDRDYVFSASIENANDATLPGRELQTRVKAAFTEAGLWPGA
ncbi:MAG: penicillin-binding transpeptidase domain-containing protein [Caulobacteraceae bacterium]